jgi:protein-tyrosine phosphatase
LFINEPAIQYLWNPTIDDGEPKPPEWFAKTIEFSLNALAQPWTKVYVHCAAGVNRGPSSAYAVMLALGWDGPTALALIKERRPTAQVGYAKDADVAVVTLGYVL